METLERDMCDILKEAAETALATESDRFHITDDASADWYLGKLAAIDAEIALIQAQMAAAVKRLQSDKNGLETLFGAELEAFISGKIASDKRGRKSVILPHGTCAFRTIPARFAVVDESAANLHAIAEEMEGAFVSVFKPGAYLELAQAVMETSGEMLPGVERIEERQSFSIKFGGKTE